MSIKPTLSVPLFDGEVSMHAFGCEHACNFSFKGIDTSPLPRSTHKEIFAALASIPSRASYYAPSPVQMNAEVLTRAGAYNTTRKSWARRRKAMPYGTYTLHRCGFADGLSGLHEHTGYVMSAADCALVVAKNGDLVIAAHAGRNSIINMQAMKGGSPRRHESVVHSIREKVEEVGLRFPETHVWVGFSISAGPHFAHAFSDPRNPQNKTMVEYVTKSYGASCFKEDGQGGTQGWLDTKELIRRQFVTLGVPEEHVELDSICTYSDMVKGDYTWYSNVRSGEKRNLVAVVVNQ
ncbi:MAG: laccase domain-containing protein [Candidatus Paceibacterota bacterium]